MFYLYLSLLLSVSGLVGGLMWTQAFNKRLGTVNLTTAETFMEVSSVGQEMGRRRCRKDSISTFVVL